MVMGLFWLFLAILLVQMIKIQKKEALKLLNTLYNYKTPPKKIWAALYRIDNF